MVQSGVKKSSVLHSGKYSNCWMDIKKKPWRFHFNYFEGHLKMFCVFDDLCSDFNCAIGSNQRQQLTSCPVCGGALAK